MILSGHSARAKISSDGSNREMRTDWTSGERERLDVPVGGTKRRWKAAVRFGRESDTGRDAGTGVKGMSAEAGGESNRLESLYSIDEDAIVI